MKYDPVIVCDHNIAFENDSVLHFVRRERPQLLIQNHKITHLTTAVYDGQDSWCKPVKLKHPVRIE
jgi:hypothetical protein